MKQAEFVAFAVHMRTRVASGSTSPADAFSKIWDPDLPLTTEQRSELHQTLELPFEMPMDLIPNLPLNISLK